MSTLKKSHCYTTLKLRCDDDYFLQSYSIRNTQEYKLASQTQITKST